MPIAARTKLVIEEPCLRAPSVTFSYTGPNPQDIYKKIKKLIPSIFKVDEHDIEEREFMWDRGAAEEKFRAVLNFIKEFDPYSYMEVEVSLNGSAKPSKEFGKEGSASIEVLAKFRIEYPQETLWQRSIFYDFYRSLIRRTKKNERERCKQTCAELVRTFCDELRSFLNILAAG